MICFLLSPSCPNGTNQRPTPPKRDSLPAPRALSKHLRRSILFPQLPPPDERRRSSLSLPLATLTKALFPPRAKGPRLSRSPPWLNSSRCRIPPPALLPPPEGIFRTFDDLMASVQRVAKDQGYGIVKLRASNYRDGKPTRYDLVCDRGGVKYNSTAKKRNPSTRKIDCPFRAKAVCEVQLGNQWRFALQEPRHNHEPRVPSGTPGQENAPLATSIRSFTNKLDRLSHDMAQGLMRIEQRLDNIEKRMENIEARAGGYEPRFQAIEQRLQGMEGPRMDGMGMDDVESRLLASSVM
ncbi:hypothetical protein TrVFT333_006902 [Trichoderma virens FT-333]|nr:hypothetical protein TrVFT333_006902 [Trichoderma virens FT-333]